MSATQQIGALAARMSRPDDGTAWAKIPPAGGVRGSRWEQNLLELAEAGDARFIEILRGHIQAGAIRSERAKAAALTEPADA